MEQKISRPRSDSPEIAIKPQNVEKRKSTRIKKSIARYGEIPSPPKSKATIMRQSDNPLQTTDQVQLTCEPEATTCDRVRPVVWEAPVPDALLPVRSISEAMNRIEPAVTTKLTDDGPSKGEQHGAAGHLLVEPLVAVPMETENTTDAMKKLTESPVTVSVPDIRVGRVNVKENRYEIESIVDYKVQDTMELFRVKWKGWESKWNSWEPRSNIDRCDYLLSVYFAQNPANFCIYKRFHEAKQASLTEPTSKRPQGRPPSALKDPVIFQVSKSVAQTSSPGKSQGKPQPVTLQVSETVSQTSSPGRPRRRPRSLLKNPLILQVTQPVAQTSSPGRPRGRPRSVLNIRMTLQVSETVAQKSSHTTRGTQTPAVQPVSLEADPEACAASTTSAVSNLNLMQKSDSVLETTDPSIPKSASQNHADILAPEIKRNSRGRPRKVPVVQQEVNMDHGEGSNIRRTRNSTSGSAPEIAVGLVDPKENIYCVEEIMNYKVQAKKEYFLVKWEGWESKWNSWEPAEHVDSCPILINEFFERNPNKLKVRENFLKKESNTRRKLKNLTSRNSDSSPPTAAALDTNGASAILNVSTPLPSRTVSSPDEATTLHGGTTALPETATIRDIPHILCKETNKYYPIIEEDAVKDRKVQKIYSHNRGLRVYLVRFEDEPLDKRSWVKLDDARKFFRLKLAIYQQIALLNQRF